MIQERADSADAYSLKPQSTENRFSFPLLLIHVMEMSMNLTVGWRGKAWM
jgi:hypothetical protein